MKQQQPKCTSPTGRHAWEHLQNLTRTGATKPVGLYRCAACGMRKDGQAVSAKQEGGAS